MAEKTELNVASRESVALQLTMGIAAKEKLSNDSSTYRKKLLDLYSECLTATMAQRQM
jgi:hypothetical protein